MALIEKAKLANGVYTSSAGNMAQGVAWNARRLGIPATVVVPEHAPESKLAAIERLGADYIQAPYEGWWQVMFTHHETFPPHNFVAPRLQLKERFSGSSTRLLPEPILTAALEKRWPSTTSSKTYRC
jgi:hypothetical protein